MSNFQGHNNIKRHDGSNRDGWYEYTCAHCGLKISGAVISSYDYDQYHLKWLLCPNCTDASVLTKEGLVYPGVPFGPNIEGLPDGVREAYTEARQCMSINALTASELICRKILMHVAVDKGAKEGENFGAYLSHLESQGYVTPPMKPWVDLIRQHGNRATHRLEAPDRKRAESSLMFTAELLRLIYEMEYVARQYIPSP
jgi:hypothetical protein